MGENLRDQYDFAFCGVAPLSSMTSSRVCETHHAIIEMKGKHAIYADDWSFCGFGDSVRYTLNSWGKYLEYKNFPYSSDLTNKVRSSLELMMTANKSFNAPVLAPMFPWGDHKFLMTGTKASGNYDAKLFTVDPSAWLKYPNVDIPKPLNKKRQWVMAALSDHSRWVQKQGPKFPIEYVGNKRMEGTKVLSEGNTVQLFADSFGVLSAGYPSAGSGWWRTRYLNAAWAESLVYSDPRDAAIMGRPYQGTMQEFESITTEIEYSTRVEEQAFWLSKNISTKDNVKTIIERLLAK